MLEQPAGERVSCLLNPESLVVRRQAGIRPRPSTTGRLTGLGSADDALLFTGGGRTELGLDLLFDVSLAGSTVSTEDVRDLTRPLWELAETAHDSEGRAQPRPVRFVWGKAWNIPGVVTAVAERLERFSSAGVPSRSWLRMSFLRVTERPPERSLTDAPSPFAPADLKPPEGEARLNHRLLGDGAGGGERLDQLAFHYYGHSSFWRLLARANRAIGNPLKLPERLLIEVPDRPAPEKPS